MLRNALGRREERDEVFGDVQRFDRADAQPLDRRFVEDAAEQINEFNAWRKIAAIRAEIDAAEDDFSIAGVAKALNFVDHLVGRKAAAFSPDERNHAVGAAAVAAVLDFQDRARVIALAAENGSGEEGSLPKDVAGEDFGAGVVQRHAIGLEGEGGTKGFGGDEVVA